MITKKESIVITIVAFAIVLVIYGIIFKIIWDMPSKKERTAQIYRKINQCMGTAYENPLEYLTNSIKIGMSKEEVMRAVKCYDEYRVSADTRPGPDEMCKEVLMYSFFGKDSSRGYLIICFDDNFQVLRRHYLIS